MRIDQYAYFCLTSLEINASEISARVGSEPDEAVARGHRQQDPPVPVAHRWQIMCRTPSLSVDEQISNVLTRVRPFAPRIRALIDSSDVTAGLQIVRYINTPEGQDNLFGWHLDIEDLDLLVSMRADIDVDEYGLDG